MLNRNSDLDTIAQRARALRRDMTTAERTLWKHLREKQILGLRFRRQEPVGNYIADFYCHLARLVVELDGSSHEDRREADALRDDVLHAEGYLVLRFRNEDVFTSLEHVLLSITNACHKAKQNQSD